MIDVASHHERGRANASAVDVAVGEGKISVAGVVLSLHNIA